jgi:hypothetical protein
MRDHLQRINVTLLDQFEQLFPIHVHRRLSVADEADATFHQRADVEVVSLKGVVGLLEAKMRRGAGPVGQMAADFAFYNGASRVVVIDANWRLGYIKSEIPRVETLDYSKLGRKESVTGKLKEMCNNRGPDVALECVVGE